MYILLAMHFTFKHLFHTDGFDYGKGRGMNRAFKSVSYYIYVINKQAVFVSHGDLWILKDSRLIS